MSDADYRAHTHVLARLIRLEVEDIVSRRETYTFMAEGRKLNEIGEMLDQKLSEALPPGNDAQAMWASPLFTLRDLLNYQWRNLPTDRLVRLAIVTIIELLTAQPPA